MSNWRDRNERDAKPNSYIRSKKSPAPKDRILTENATLILTIKLLLSFLIGLLLSLSLWFFSNRKNEYATNHSSREPNEYICKESSQENSETLAIYSGVEQRFLIGWTAKVANDRIAAGRCVQITERLNKYNDSKKVKYMAYQTTKDSAKFCLLKSLEESCNQENNIVNIVDRGKASYKDIDTYEFDSKLIDFIEIDRCRIYPNLKIKGSNKVSGDRQVCIIPLREDAQ
jgi:hypothetical protein